METIRNDKGDSDDAASGISIPSLRIQTVLFRNTIGEVDRFLRGAANAARVARNHGRLGRVSLAIGDSSPLPLLPNDKVQQITTELAEADIEFTYVFFGANLGSAGGHNRLWQDFDEEFVLILNPDAFASPHLVMELALPLADPKVGIAEARQIPLEHPKDFDRASGDTSWSVMAGTMIRRSVIGATGGFDSESFFLYCDDVDFCWRARLSGFRVVYQPSARIFHDKRLTTDGNMVVNTAETYYAAEAALILAHKYSRPDLVEKWLADLSSTSEELHLKAAQEFRRRRDAGTLPQPLDPEGKVAQFVGYNFAAHRFSYG